MKICFVTELRGFRKINSLLDEYSNKYNITVTTKMPKNDNDFQLIVLWNISKIINDLPIKKNVLVFHSSDLPEGKGWAPIYYALAEDKSDHVITAFLVNSEVDSGDIVAKARVKIYPSYIAGSLRAVDEKVCLNLAFMILERYGCNLIKGKPQFGKGSYRPKRTSVDGKININNAFIDIIPHLRGCGNENHAFFEWRGEEYKVFIKPKNQPTFPKNIHYEFFDE